MANAAKNARKSVKTTKNVKNTASAKKSSKSSAKKLDKRVVGTSSQGFNTTKEALRGKDAKHKFAVGALIHHQGLGFGDVPQATVKSWNSDGTMNIEFTNGQKSNMVSIDGWKKVSVAKPKFAVGDLVTLNTLKAEKGQKRYAPAPVVYTFVGDGVSGPLGTQMYRVGRDPFFNVYEESRLVLVKKHKPARAIRVGDRVADVGVPIIPLRGRVMEIPNTGGVKVAYVGDEEVTATYPLHELMLYRKPSAADHIRHAWTTARNAKEETLVWVARASKPSKLIGWVGDIRDDEVDVAIEGKGHETIKIRDLVLWSSPNESKIGTAAEQHKSYAKIAKKYKIGAEVQELNGERRKGTIVGHSGAEGNTYVDVRFDDAGELPQAKHVSNLKLIAARKAKLKKGTEPKFATNDLVMHPAHGQGLVCGPTKTEGVFEVNFDLAEGDDASQYEGDEIHQDELKLVKAAPRPKFKKGDQVEHPTHGRGVIVTQTKTDGVYGVQFVGTPVEAQPHEVHQDELTLVQSADEQEREGRKAGRAAAKKTRKIPFEDINIFAGFIAKDRTFVKVSKSNGIPVVINGSADEPFAMLATPATKIAASSIQRFKKSDRVVPYPGLPVSAKQ